MKSSAELKKDILAIDHRGYPGYKGLRGRYQFKDHVLSIDHVQGDPFASPSHLSVHVDGHKAGFPKDYYQDDISRITLQDHLTRCFGRALAPFSFKAKGSGKSGLLSVSHCGQQVLERTACEVSADGSVTVRFEAGFPANGRSVNAGELVKMLFQFVPEAAQIALFYDRLNKNALKAAIELARDQQFIREHLSEQGLSAFLADGSVLPRESGISDRPMKGAVPFQSPASCAVTVTLPYHGPVTGMGIKKGITLFVGGGYHGKSTILQALEMGVYNHIAGDGREYVITDPSAWKLRAEDGRSISHTDISPFINHLPNKKDTVHFSTEDASGSTSQAANLMEAVESGSKLLLIDEDTSATNFMIRDELMQRVVNRNQEPITPFIERVQWLSDAQGISSILVAGSSGSYFHVADTILQMDHYKPVDITAFAKKEAEAFPSIQPSAPSGAVADYRRVIQPDPAFRPDRRLKMKVLGMDSISVNHDAIDLRCLEQLTDPEQIQALSALLCYMERRLFNGKDTLHQIMDQLDKELSTRGLEILSEGGRLAPNLAMPRIQEVYACINRFRGLKI